MPFKSLELIEDVKIDSIITIHYFEYMSDYSFPGESHDFWEFLCVDKGEVEITADNRAYTLKKEKLFSISQMNSIPFVLTEKLPLIWWLFPLTVPLPVWIIFRI